MKKTSYSSSTDLLIFLLAATLAPLAGWAQAPMHVQGSSPTHNASATARATNVTLTYSQPVDATTASAVRVFSQQAGGRKAATVTTDGNTVKIDPSNDFRPGETVFITSPAAVQTTSGAASVPYVSQFTAQAGPGPGTFGGGSEVNVAGVVRGVTVGDVDGDGDLDLLTANNDGAVSIRLNDGKGNFSAGGDVSMSTNLYCLAVADVDGDGDLDLLAASAGNPGGVNVRLNDGTGKFGANRPVAVGSSPRSMAIADVDGDGDLDLLVAIDYPGMVSIRLNDGTGLFSGGSDVSVGDYAQSVSVGDVDGDGDLDLVAACTGNGTSGSMASVRLNNGKGVFSFSSDISGFAQLFFGPEGVNLADVDGDGDLDLLTANGYSGPYPASASVLFNNGTGTFTSSSSSRPISVGDNPHMVITADVNGDGNLDLLTINRQTASVRLNNGNGVFLSGSDLALDNSPTSLAAADIDGDGDLDLLIGNLGTNTVSVRLNQASTYRLHAGGGALATSRGAFAADQYYSSASSTLATGATIAGTSDQALYQTERYSTAGRLGYAVPVANGTYSVVLHFAEIYWTQPGQRVFDVSVEGRKVLDDYDIVKKVGPLAATTETFTVTVADGVLNVDLSALAADGGADQAKLSALEIISAPNSTPNAASRGAGATTALALTTAFSAYPNPSNGRFTVAYTASAAQSATLLLTDQLGRVAQQQQVHVQPGRNETALQAGALAQGLYLLTLRTADGQRQSLKILIQP